MEGLKTKQEYVIDIHYSIIFKDSLFVLLY